MKKVITKVLVLGVVSVVMFGGMEAAQAAGFNVTTSLSIKAPNSVKKGVPFKIKGTLKSSQPSCVSNSFVRLVKGHKIIQTKSTNGTGHVTFKTKAKGSKNKVKYHLNFAGKVSGVHPNIQICGASTSPTKTVKIT